MMSYKDVLHRLFSRQNLTDYQLLKAAEKRYGSKRAVAERLGVSTRHVQRLMKQGRENAGRIRSSAGLRQRIGGMYNTPELRQAMKAPRRAQTVSGGAKVYMYGYLGVQTRKTDALRLRDMEWNISGESMQRIREAWETGDDEHAREVMRELIGREYGVPDWNWADDSTFEMKFTTN